MEYVSPTGLGLRNDSGGLGHYGAPRVKRIDGRDIRYRHKGVDFQCMAGQDVVAMGPGDFVRIVYPYADLTYQGFVLQCARAVFKVFYVKINQDLIGEYVLQGQVVGQAEAISKRYPDSGVTDHVHVEVIECDPKYLLPFACYAGAKQWR